MKSIFSPLVCLLLLALAAQPALAQKFGHLNSQELLSLMPELKSANTKLETFAKQKDEAFSKKYQALEQRYAQSMQEVQGGKLSPIQQQQREQELNKEMEELGKLEEQYAKEVEAKREELYKPLLDKVNAAIKAVGTEGKYDYIFDTSMGAFVFAADSENVLAKVKAKLGI